MIIVRSVFQATPGNASKLAAQLKAAAATGKLPRHRVLTDVTGAFNRVILEYEINTISEFGAQFEDYATNEAVRATLKGYTSLFATGHRELLQTA